MAQSEEQEPALFMVSASVLTLFPNSESKSSEAIDDDAASVSVIDEWSIDPEEEVQLGVAQAPAGELIQLKEEQVFT